MRSKWGKWVAVAVLTLLAVPSVWARKVPTKGERWAPDVVIVKMKPGASVASLASGLSLHKRTAQLALAVTTAEPLFETVKPEERTFGLDRIYKVHITGPYSPAYVARELSLLPDVEYAEPDYVYEVHFTPNDSLFGQQWYLRDVRAPEAWDLEQGSRSVIIAIIDTGVDIDHPDLASEIWTNADEIPNNGVDDDGNGFVDDVHGWDFVNGVADPNPKPNGQDEDNDGTPDDGTDHGTQMAGLAAAATNNGKGIAAGGFKCLIMPIKSLSDEGSGYLSDLTKGIRYAIDNGADVVNMSFGGGGYSSAQRDVIQYGLSKDVVFVGAAGNDHSSEAHYPSGYEGVLSVAATGFSGKLSSISNYGVTVDVAAPGGDFNVHPPAEIISTAPYFPQYGFRDLYRARTKEGWLTAGTSSASAIVSGVAGLVRSHYPNLSWLEVQQRIVATCDNIDSVNPGYEGMIGAGMVDAYRAIAEENPPPVPPRIVLESARVTDATLGDGDGLFEHNEIVTVTATYHNYSVGVGHDVVITLSSEDSAVQVLQAEYVIPELPPDSTVEMQTPLSFRIRPDAKGHVAKIVLTHRSGSTVGSDTVLVTIGKTPVLVVDDDHTGGNGTNLEIEAYTTEVLNALGVNYSLWDLAKSGHPSGDFLKHFPTVIWLCEWAFPSLEAQDRLAIAKFLRNGGSLFLSGQDIGWDLCDPSSDNSNSGAISFFNKWLHAEYVADNANDDHVRGVVGDPISDGLDFHIYQPGRSQDNQYPDVINPLDSARTIFTYSDGRSAAIRYSGDYRVVYLGFGFEAVDSKYSTTPWEPSTTKLELMARVLEWLSTIEHEPLDDTEDVNQSRQVMATLHGDISDLEAVRLYWKKENETEFHEVDMALAGDRLYVGTIPAPGEATDVDYYIQTVNPYFSETKPTGAPERVFTFHAGPDTLPPVIQYEPIANSLDGEHPFQVTTKVTDNMSVDGTSVVVHFFTQTVRDSARLERGDLPGTFQGSIPPVFAYGDTVHYFISARDSSSQHNLGRSDTSSFVVGLEDFEHGLDDWVTPQGGWGLETLYAHSGDFSVNDSPGHQYPNNANVTLETRFGFDLSEADAAVLRFWTKYFLEFGHDYGYVEVSTDSGKTWVQIGDSLNGVQSQWVQKEISLTPFTGPGHTDVRLRFRMQSDATQVPPFFGWFVDDVQVVEGIEVGVAEPRASVVPKETALHQNYPNPFNPTTTISYDLASAAQVRVMIYNLLGQAVRTLVNAKQKPGSYRVLWDGRDDRGAAVPGGVYLVRLEAGDVRAVRKLLFLK